MTAPITDATPLCVLQEMAYTLGWRDYGMGRVTGGQGPFTRKPYARGWLDHQTRDKCKTMYARRDTNERTQR